jgi:hypothetical protein
MFSRPREGRKEVESMERDTGILDGDFRTIFEDEDGGFFVYVDGEKYYMDLEK